MAAKTQVLTTAEFETLVRQAELEGRTLTDAERLLNPVLQKELAAQKAQAIESAEKAVETAEAHFKQAKKNLADTIKENS